MAICDNGSCVKLRKAQAIIFSEEVHFILVIHFYSPIVLQKQNKLFKNPIYAFQYERPEGSPAFN